jgi:hypothetical protein
MQSGGHRQKFPELPLGTEAQFSTAILNAHPELGPPRIPGTLRLDLILDNSSGVVADASALRAASIVMTGWAIWEPYRKTIAMAGGQRRCRRKARSRAMTIPALPTIT